MATEHDIIPGITTRREDATGFFQKMVSKGLGWARKNSLWQYPFVTACCGMEYMSVSSARYDIARFGAEVPRFSPRQADLLLVVGTVNCKQAPILKRVYEQMSEPEQVLDGLMLLQRKIQNQQHKLIDRSPLPVLATEGQGR